MAKITITLEDMPEGISIAVQADSPLAPDSPENTDAQQLALQMLEMVKEADEIIPGHDCDENCQH